MRLHSRSLSMQLHMSVSKGSAVACMLGQWRGTGLSFKTRHSRKLLVFPNFPGGGRLRMHCSKTCTLQASDAAYDGTQRYPSNKAGPVGRHRAVRSASAPRKWWPNTCAFSWCHLLRVFPHAMAQIHVTAFGHSLKRLRNFAAARDFGGQSDAGEHQRDVERDTVHLKQLVYCARYLAILK